jgi:hypothetical protein
MSMIWDEQYAFVSSSFRDMHAARELCNLIVCPELEERLKARRHYLLPVELRWGVETEDLRSNASDPPEIVQTRLAIEILCRCMDALSQYDRREPLVIVFLNDRYGWVPDPAQAQAAALALNWTGGDVRLWGVTEPELEYGILDDDNRLPRCRFYFRDPLPYDRMPASVRDAYLTDPATLPDEADRLAALKQRIQQDPRFAGGWRCCPATWDEAGQKVILPAGFDRTLVDDLWADLDEMTRARACGTPTTWQDQEEHLLQDFIDRRGHGFLGREELVGELLDAALGDDGTASAVTVLQGPLGVGKSSLFAQICGRLSEHLSKRGLVLTVPRLPEADRQHLRRLKTRHVLVLAHSFGISRRALTADNVLLRWGRGGSCGSSGNE